MLELAVSNQTPGRASVDKEARSKPSQSQEETWDPRTPSSLTPFEYGTGNADVMTGDNW